MGLQRDLVMDDTGERRVDITEVTKEDEDRGCRNAGTKEQVALRMLDTGYRMCMQWIIIGPETTIKEEASSKGLRPVQASVLRVK